MSINQERKISSHRSTDRSTQTHIFASERCLLEGGHWSPTGQEASKPSSMAVMSNLCLKNGGSIFMGNQFKEGLCNLLSHESHHGVHWQLETLHAHPPQGNDYYLLLCHGSDQIASSSLSTFASTGCVTVTHNHRRYLLFSHASIECYIHGMSQQWKHCGWV